MGNMCSGGRGYSPVLSFEESFSMLNQVGEGSTALVFKAKCKAALSKELPSGHIVAVKVLDKTKFSREEVLELSKEAAHLKDLRHKSIIRLHAFFDESPVKSWMVLEMITGGDVFERLEQRTVYTETAARDLMRNLLEALVYLRSKGVAHRDLKLAALMLRTKQSDTEIVLMDFGLAAKCKGRTLTDECGTPGYVAPEVIGNAGATTTPYGCEVDVWSAGVVAFILLAGYPPFYSETGDDAEVYAKISSGDHGGLYPPQFWDPVTPQARSFVSSLLTMGQASRPTPQQCLKHEWLSAKHAGAVKTSDQARGKPKQGGGRQGTGKPPALGGKPPALSSGKGRK